MKAIQAPNVAVHFTPVVQVKPNSVVGEDGTEVEVDTVVCATGFDVSYKPRFPIVGRDGVDLAERWAKTPEAYLGVGVPELPNFLTFIGPTVCYSASAAASRSNLCPMLACKIILTDAQPNSGRSRTAP